MPSTLIEVLFLTASGAVLFTVLTSPIFYLFFEREAAAGTLSKISIRPMPAGSVAIVLSMLVVLAAALTMSTTSRVVRDHKRAPAPVLEGVPPLEPIGTKQFLTSSAPNIDGHAAVGLARRSAESLLGFGYRRDKFIELIPTRRGKYRNIVMVRSNFSANVHSVTFMFASQDSTKANGLRIEITNQKPLQSFVVDPPRVLKAISIAYSGEYCASPPPCRIEFFGAK